MKMSLIGPDIKILREMYDEALKLRGIPAKYQYPIRPDTNDHAESLVDSYSIEENVHIFFESSPKARTFKRLGWVVENNKELPFLIHCSFNLKNLQKDSIFKFSGLYADLPDRTFRVVEISYDLEAPDHLTCQVVPVYDTQLVGRTDKEIQMKFNKSNTFLRNNFDYRGDYYSTKEDGQSFDNSKE